MMQRIETGLRLSHPSPSRSRRGQRGQRGSVLLFAVIVLSILVVVATTFLVVTRQARAAANNSVNTTMAEMAARAAVADAQRVLRETLAGNNICTYDGVFDATQPRYLQTVYDPLVNGRVRTNPFRHFEVDAVDADFANSALLYYDETQLYNNTASGGAPRAFYTTSPLAISAYPSGQVRDTLSWASGGGASLPHDGSAVRNLLARSPGPTDFDGFQGSVKKLSKIGNVRGEYYVWIADLDAKLCGVSQDWGIDTLTTLDPTLDPASGGPAGGPYDTDPLVAQANWNAALQQGALAWLNDYGVSIDPASTNWGYAGTQYAGLEFGALGDDASVIAGIPANTGLRSVREFALKLPSVSDPLDTQYLPRRGAIDYYFTVHKDIPDPGVALAAKFSKDHPAALNINTASPEVIAAALSQIPADMDGETLGSSDSERPLKIARRIVAKRPFLCRMDFEDFLAAQIKGTCSDPDADPGFTPELLVLPPVGDPLWDGTDATYWYDPPASSVLYFAIGRRPGPGTTVLPTDNLYQATPELTLSQYLEIPGVDPADPSFCNGAAEELPNEPRFQLARFRYFFDEANRSAAYADGSLITFKEFNNIINSVTSIYVNDDAQTAFPGAVASVAVTAGTDGKLQTTPQGDDVYNDPNNPTQILAGPNGVVETWTSANRPSYYSFSDDLAALDQFWDATIGDTSIDLSVTPRPEEKTFAASVRLYCRLRPGTGTPPGRRQATQMSDLLSWRALPQPGAGARQSGFYQFTFYGDQWTFMASMSLNVEDYGFLQSSTDQSDPYELALCSSAQANSGTVRAPNPTGNGDVSWSPQFAFRSRYFAIYALGRGLLQTKDGATPKVSGEVRMEALYDALEDRTLWTRTQLSDKRALGEP